LETINYNKFDPVI